MLRQYATTHTIASQKGQRTAGSNPCVLPGTPRGTPTEEDRTRAEESRATRTRSSSHPETVRRGQQVRHLLRVSSHGAAQTRASNVCNHLSSPGLPAQPPASIPTHEDVLLQAAHARPMSLRLPGLPVRVYESTSKDDMEMSSLPGQSHRDGEKILSRDPPEPGRGQSQKKLVQRITCASDAFAKHGEGLCQIGTTPVPWRRPSHWDRFHVMLLRTMYLHPLAKTHAMDDLSFIILCCLALLNFLVG